MWHTYKAGSSGISGRSPAAFDAALNLVRDENPGLNLTVTEVDLSELFISYQLQAPSGTPDVIFAPNDNEGSMAGAGLSLDLTSAFTADELNRYSRLALDGSTVNRQLVQVPATVRSVGIYYRADRSPTFPGTTDQLIQAIQGGLKLGLYESIYQVFGFWGAFGGKLMDDDGKCVADSTGVAQAFDYYAALKTAGAKWYGPAAYDEMVADFHSGALDAVIDGPWAGDAYRDANASVAVAPLPAGPGGPALPMIGVDGWTVNPHSANTALAIAFAKRMTQPDVLGILSSQAIQIPADMSVQPSDALSAQFAAAAQAGDVRPQLPQLGAFWGRFTTALTSVVENGADPQQAVADACAQMNSDNGL
jgi:arabinogalactan oligomer/maltooligosaccharide transport system substrate-binding protein